MKPEKVFVYGTLRTGGPTTLLSGYRLWEVVTEGGVCLYPAILPAEPHETVVGEILAVSSLDLRVLDRYEGYDPDNTENSQYLRTRVSIDNQSVWTYVWSPSRASRRWEEGPLPYGIYLRETPHRDWADIDRGFFPESR